MGACTAVSGTDGAAAVLDARTGVDARPPHVALRALPPDIPAAARHDHLRRQLAVERRMPLGGNVGRGGRKIVIACEHLATCAVGAALLARGAERDTHGKQVALITAPPCHRRTRAGFPHALTFLVRRNPYSVPPLAAERYENHDEIEKRAIETQAKRPTKRKNAHKSIVSKNRAF